MTEAPLLAQAPDDSEEGAPCAAPGRLARMISGIAGARAAMAKSARARAKKLGESWAEASLAKRATFGVALAIGASALYYVGTMAHDYVREMRYSSLSPQKTKLTGILPDNAKISAIDAPLPDYLDSLIPKDYKEAAARKKAAGDAVLKLSSEDIKRLADDRGRTLPDPFKASREADAAFAKAKGAELTAYEFIDDSGLDGSIHNLLLIKLADGSLHAKSATPLDRTLFEQKWNELGLPSKSAKTIETSAIETHEQDNLSGLAIRLGTPDQRAAHNLKAAMIALVNVGFFAIMIFFAFSMLRRAPSKDLAFIPPSKIKGSIADLVGMEDIKAEVLRAKDFLGDRARYKEYGVERPANILFSGPPGTGKTKLAGYLAKSLGLPILFHSAANLETGYVNGGGQTLEKALSMAKKHKRCIVFLDEAQDLFMKRGGHRKFDDDTQNMLLSILDGVRTTEESEIIWIVASNFNANTMEQDEAMLRRFPMKIDFRLPNAEERRGIFSHYLSKAGSKQSPDIDLDALIQFTENCSPADLEEIVREASMDCGSRKALIDTEALNRASERMIIGNTDEGTTSGRDAERELIALHEAGHFLCDAMRHCGRDIAALALAKGKVAAVKISLKANARSGALGFVLRRPGRSLLQTKADIEWEARALYGGMANEEIFFGADGVTTGAYNDIQQATKLISRAVRDMGMFKASKINLSALDPKGEVNAEDRALMERESQRLFDEAKAMLVTCKEASRLAADLLLAAGEMSSDALIDALAARFGAPA